MYGVYGFRKGITRQSTKRSFKVDFNEKRGTKNVCDFDSGHVWRLKY